MAACDMPAGGGSAQLPRIGVDRLYIDGSHVKAIVRITNDVEPRGYRLVGMKCTFLRKGLAVDSSGNITTNVAYGQTVFETVIGPERDTAIDSVDCRVTYANL